MWGRGGGLSLALVRVRSRQQHSDNFDWRIRDQGQQPSWLHSQKSEGNKKTVPLCVKDTKAIVGHGYVMPYKLQMIAHKLF